MPVNGSFCQNELIMFGSPKTVDLALKLNPNFIATNNKVFKANDLREWRMRVGELFIRIPVRARVRHFNSACVRLQIVTTSCAKGDHCNLIETQLQ